MFETHISEEWRQNPKVMELMNSQLALDVFVPATWQGLDIPPITIRTTDDLPASHKPKARNLNPKHKESAFAELGRMNQYFYVDSDSPIACPLVIADKATFPFIRICGDYVFINKYIITGQYYIPNVVKELLKAAGFSLYCDMDLSNAFHQIPLDQKSSELLSVVTPWGLKRPLFLPEGVSPGSGQLQRVVMEIFSDYSDLMITLFDNVLILSHTE